MGYSCTVSANDTLEKIERIVCKGPVSNSWKHKSEEFFFEVDKSVQDGGISGKIYRILKNPVDPKITYVRDGSFRINDNGMIKHFPHITRSARRLVELR